MTPTSPAGRPTPTVRGTAVGASGRARGGVTAPALAPALVPALAAALALAPAGAGAQATGSDPAAEARGPEAEVLVLGTFHFANPGLDVVNMEVPDVLSPDKQAEIEAVAEALAALRPTRVLVERLPERGPWLDSLYAEYRAGRHALARDETQQIGFRLAARFDLDRVHPIDHSGDFPFEAVLEYAQAHDPAFVEHLMAELGRVEEVGNRQQREWSIGRILRESNDPLKLEQDHGLYVRFAGVGAGDGYAGANLLAKWYERNIRIFANIQDVVEPGDRVLLVIGAGHAPILRELIRYDAGMVLVEAVDYLPDS